MVFDVERREIGVESVERERVLEWIVSRVRSARGRRHRRPRPVLPTPASQGDGRHRGGRGLAWTLWPAAAFGRAEGRIRPGTEAPDPAADPLEPGIVAEVGADEAQWVL